MKRFNLTYDDCCLICDVLDGYASACDSAGDSKQAFFARSVSLKVADAVEEDARRCLQLALEVKG